MHVNIANDVATYNDNYYCTLAELLQAPLKQIVQKSVLSSEVNSSLDTIQWHVVISVYGHVSDEVMCKK